MRFSFGHRGIDDTVLDLPPAVEDLRLAQLAHVLECGVQREEVAERADLGGYRRPPSSRR